MAGNRTFIYVDGFNLYHGAIKGTRHHWFDIPEAMRRLLPGCDINLIRYFTAVVSDRPDDPQKSLRQMTYIRALRALGTVSVDFGTFVTQKRYMPLASSIGTGKTPQLVQVLRTDEKGSDVNLATALVDDAHRDRFDTAVMVTNDADLVSPVRLVSRDIGKQVGIVTPHARGSRALAKHADFVRQLRPSLVGVCQFFGCRG